MIFAVQHFLEDHFEARGLSDPDNYAIQAANTFNAMGASASEREIAVRLHRARTAFFRTNRGLQRARFELELAATLRRRFKGARSDSTVADFLDHLGPARARLSAKRRSIDALMQEFKRGVEARAIDTFWESRKKGLLRKKPEKLAQGLLAMFAKGVIGTKGFVIRELASGIGFVDLGISFSGVMHLVEIKMLSGKLTGPNQLANYMANEGRRAGWLVLMDVRASRGRKPLPETMATRSGLVRILTVELNPIAPHDM